MSGRGNPDVKQGFGSTLFLCADEQFNGMQKRTPHIGELIKEVVTRKGVKASWIAEQLGCHRNNVYLIFSRSWIDTETLMKLSRILNHDFFADLSAVYKQE